MSDDWDFYFARVNDAVSSIFVDLGIRADVPLEKRPWLLWVFVAAGFFWLGIMFALSFSDYLTRDWLPQPAGWESD